MIESIQSTIDFIHLVVEDRWTKIADDTCADTDDKRRTCATIIIYKTGHEFDLP
jgi:hypothetical protein